MGRRFAKLLKTSFFFGGGGSLATWRNGASTAGGWKGANEPRKFLWTPGSELELPHVLQGHVVKGPFKGGAQRASFGFQERNEFKEYPPKQDVRFRRYSEAALF